MQRYNNHRYELYQYPDNGKWGVIFFTEPLAPGEMNPFEQGPTYETKSEANQAVRNYLNSPHLRD